MKKITLTNYKADPYYPEIVRVVSNILTEDKVVSPVEVFVRLKLLSKEDLPATHSPSARALCKRHERGCVAATLVASDSKGCRPDFSVGSCGRSHSR